jgi:hypothetical protein
MNNFLNFTRPSRFLKPGRSLLLLMLFVFCTAAFATPTTPTSDFIDNGDGTVTHKLTGLVWMRCAMGQTWDKTTSSCTGTEAMYTYAQVMALTSNFAGYSDWRLPNIAELQTIVERDNYAPAINTTLFPNTSFNLTWSASRTASRTGPWLVGFGNGINMAARSGVPYFVRLVRGRPWIVGSLPLTTPTANFTDNNDGTVTHKRTGLIWQRCFVGQTWTGTACLGATTNYTWDVATTTLKSNFAGKSDWRIPNLNELLSIVEYGSYNPAINAKIFPNPLIYGWIWSSSPHAYYIHEAWAVSFYAGHAYSSYKEDGRFSAVLLVRGQWGTPSLSFDFPDGTLAGDTEGWVNLLSFGNPLGTYMGLIAYMNNADGSGIYQSNDLAFRFAKNVLHLTSPAKPAGKKLAAANNGKVGYVVLNGNHVDIIAKYYPTGSTMPPVNGSIISQTSTVLAGHVSIAKKIVTIDDNTLDVYLFEQNWILGSLIADSRKMRFTKNAAGEWTGKTTLSNKAVGWLNPEIK